jgi:2-hydroxychromene-2-carboxylate isomerase
MSARDTLQRRVLPRAIVAASTVRTPGRTAAALRRARGGRAHVRLFVAFDDPYSAVAVLGLGDRLTGRRADLLVEPVVARGIPGDPAVDAKRRYAVVDARRLALRDDRTLTRDAPLPAADTAFLAAWAAALPDAADRAAFTAAGLHELWFGAGDGPIDPAPYAALWRAHGGGDAAPPAEHPGVAAAERTMRRRGLYDTPIALVHGQWFFAHERLAQIEHRLDELGWRPAS